MTTYKEFKHKNFMVIFKSLINEAETAEERAVIFTLWDYVNHLNQRLIALEEES